MNELTNMISNIDINKPNEILLNIIDHDFTKLADLFIKGDTNIIIEANSTNDYYLTSENCLIIYNYLSNNYTGYNLLKNKININLITKRFNIILNDNDIKTYVDYYLDNFLIYF